MRFSSTAATSVSSAHVGSAQNEHTCVGSGTTCEYCRNHLNNLIWPSGYRLPPIPEMAPMIYNRPDPGYSSIETHWMSASASSPDANASSTAPQSGQARRYRGPPGMPSQ